jgi:hypothetical protein
MLVTALSALGAACTLAAPSDDDLARAPTCTDGDLNGAETGVDCGGVDCTPCDDGLACVGPEDCLSGVCDESECASPTCSDGVKNGTERGVDCGEEGGCDPKCGNGAPCEGDDGCVSDNCLEAECRDPLCTDATQNGDETDVDCGGACPRCAVGGACLEHGDCESLNCSTAGACIP